MLTLLWKFMREVVIQLFFKYIDKVFKQSENLIKELDWSGPQVQPDSIIHYQPI